MEVPTRVQEFLHPDERVLFVSRQKRSISRLNLKKRSDTLVVTDRSILLYESDPFQSALGMDSVTDFAYSQIAYVTINNGAIWSTLEIIERAGGKPVEIEYVAKDDAVEVFQIVRAQLSRIQSNEQTTATGQAVMTFCRYCGTLMSHNTITCPNCGSRITG